MEKKELREKIIKARKAMNSLDKTAADEAILHRLLAYPEYLEAEEIFVYVSLPDEVDTAKLIRSALDAGKLVAVPRVEKKTMNFYRISGKEDLAPGTMGILEPGDGCRLATPGEKALIVMPGLAFDEERNRMGYGGGFYDRYLAGDGAGCRTVAVAYEVQITDHVPCDRHDKKPASIITERRVLK
ncbi:MAG: 5-formyltetrahydrofolate cyclo-ligase [Anaerovoracaceae bacterium]|jgi:5-formyltetrahydrofolate cyclo-ligase